MNIEFQRTLLIACLFSLLAGPGPAAAQNVGGDQFLDGIGETALVARYLFDGNTADRSRNGLKATLHGTGATYIDDTQFGKVLSLPGTGGAFVQIPGESLEAVDAVTVTGWMFLRSAEPWQRFFDCGPNTTSNFFCTPIGEGDSEGYRARIKQSGWTNEQGPTAPRVPTNRWVHLAVVMDAPRHTMSLYLDGARVSQSTNLTVNLDPLLDPDDARRNQLFLGKSRYDTDPYLNAKLHDVRLYSIALTDQQVAVICRNALSGEKPAAPVTPAVARGETDATRKRGPHPFELVSVPDVSVETPVGTLPRLPRTVPGVYRHGAKGPSVRVIWPAPTNNQQVLQPGTVTITGRVAGTTIEPKATITIRAEATESPAPIRSVETFPLDRVTLNPDEQQRATPFMQHRDKFIQGLARTAPDRFLYMFRDAFGQKQPENVQPLGGWDNQTTRLRGHASGHYLSAIAQAYASTGYDPVHKHPIGAVQRLKVA